MNAIHKAGALILKDKKMMVVRPFKEPFFITPGGKYEEGEDYQACLKRELKEEIDADLVSAKYYKTYELKAGNTKRDLTLELYIVEINGKTTSSGEIETIAWLSREDFENRIFNLPPSFGHFVPDLMRDGLL